MKKWILSTIVLLLVLAITSVPAICAQSEKKLKKISLKYSDHIPPMAGGNIFLKKQYFPRLQEQLAEKGYELDITFYHAESLYKSTQQVQACEQGLIDMTVVVVPYETARFPLHELLDFGFMGWDHESMPKIWADLKKSVPEFGQEMTNHFEEFLRFIPTRKLIHTNLGPDTRVPADFKGVKIHCAGVSSQVVRHIKAVPIRQNPGDWYTSLNRGLFDGIIVAFDMVGILKLHEVLNSHILPYEDSFGHTPVTHIFSRKKFDKLPAAVQEVFRNNFDWATETITAQELKNNLPFYTKGAKAKGSAFVELTAEETDLWRKASRTIHQKWVEEKEKEGLPGKKMYEEALRLVEKHSK